MTIGKRKFSLAEILHFIQLAIGLGIVSLLVKVGEYKAILLIYKKTSRLSLISSMCKRLKTPRTTRKFVAAWLKFAML